MPRCLIVTGLVDVVATALVSEKNLLNLMLQEMIHLVVAKILRATFY